MEEVIRMGAIHHEIGSRRISRRIDGTNGLIQRLPDRQSTVGFNRERDDGGKTCRLRGTHDADGFIRLSKCQGGDHVDLSLGQPVNLFGVVFL